MRRHRFGCKAIVYWPAQPQASPIYISLTVSGPIYRPTDPHRTPALSPAVRSGGYILVYLVQLLPAGCMGQGGGVVHS